MPGQGSRWALPRQGRAEAAAAWCEARGHAREGRATRRAAAEWKRARALQPAAAEPARHCEQEERATALDAPARPANDPEAAAPPAPGASPEAEGPRPEAPTMRWFLEAPPPGVDPLRLGLGRGTAFAPRRSSAGGRTASSTR